MSWVQLGLLSCSVRMCTVFGGELGLIKVTIFVGCNGPEGLQVPTLETLGHLGGLLLRPPSIQATNQSIRCGSLILMDEC